jgi:hypothetical protein
MAKDGTDLARCNDSGVNLTYIASDFASPPGSSGFETGYMRSLYQHGFDKAKTGDFWAKAPPWDDSLLNGFRYRRSATSQ